MRDCHRRSRCLCLPEKGNIQNTSPAVDGVCVCVCHNQQTVVDHHYVKDTSRMRNQFSQFHVRSFQPSEINEESGSSL